MIIKQKNIVLDVGTIMYNKIIVYVLVLSIVITSSLSGNNNSRKNLYFITNDHISKIGLKTINLSEIIYNDIPNVKLYQYYLCYLNKDDNHKYSNFKRSIRDSGIFQGDGGETNNNNAAINILTYNLDYLNANEYIINNTFTSSMKHNVLDILHKMIDNNILFTNGKKLSVIPMNSGGERYFNSKTNIQNHNTIWYIICPTNDYYFVDKNIIKYGNNNKDSFAKDSKSPTIYENNNKPDRIEDYLKNELKKYFNYSEIKDEQIDMDLANATVVYNNVKKNPNNETGIKDIIIDKVSIQYNLTPYIIRVRDNDRRDPKVQDPEKTQIKNKKVPNYNFKIYPQDIFIETPNRYEDKTESVYSWPFLNEINTSKLDIYAIVDNKKKDIEIDGNIIRIYDKSVSIKRSPKVNYSYNNEDNESVEDKDKELINKSLNYRVEYYSPEEEKYIYINGGIKNNLYCYEGIEYKIEVSSPFIEKQNIMINSKNFDQVNIELKIKKIKTNISWVLKQKSYRNTERDNITSPHKSAVQDIAAYKFPLMMKNIYPKYEGDDGYLLLNQDDKITSEKPDVIFVLGKKMRQQYFTISTSGIADGNIVSCKILPYNKSQNERIDESKVLNNNLKFLIDVPIKIDEGDYIEINTIKSIGYETEKETIKIFLDSLEYRSNNIIMAFQKLPELHVLYVDLKINIDKEKFINLLKKQDEYWKERGDIVIAYLSNYPSPTLGMNNIIKKILILNPGEPQYASDYKMLVSEINDIFNKNGIYNNKNIIKYYYFIPDNNIGPCIEYLISEIKSNKNEGINNITENIFIFTDSFNFSENYKKDYNIRAVSEQIKEGRLP